MSAPVEVSSIPVATAVPFVPPVAVMTAPFTVGVPASAACVSVGVALIPTMVFVPLVPAVLSMSTSIP